MSSLSQTAGAVDKKRVTRALSGEDIAFEEIVAHYQPQVTQLVYRLLGWREDEVEDVVQEVFMAVFINLDKFRGQSRISTWLTRITINKCRSWQRKRLLKMNLIQKLISFGSSSNKPRYNPGANLWENEAAAQIRRVVQSLPPRLREVVVLRYLEELSITEVAEILDLTVNAVHVRLNRARKQIKNELSGIIENE
ncbi:MAG: RNA polymerase sigma factor [Sedimentisphaerales bacterium]|nr:RNA polymerase sigma factor [Sedimentisphaerales bacterium]